MELRTFGRTRRVVSSLGLGTWQMGGDEWGPRDDQLSIDVLRAAISHGITLVDTADVYGMGHSEELIGVAVPPGANMLLVTKIGWDIYTEPLVVGGSRRRYDAAYLEHAAAEARRRLRRDRLDVCLLHNPTREDLSDGSALRVMRKLQARGWMSWVGASVGNEDDARAALEAGVDVLEVPFNVVRNWARFILPIASAAGVAVVAREPFERGLLTGKYGPNATFQRVTTVLARASIGCWQRSPARRASQKWRLGAAFRRRRSRSRTCSHTLKWHPWSPVPAACASSFRISRRQTCGWIQRSCMSSMLAKPGSTEQPRLTALASPVPGFVGGVTTGAGRPGPGEELTADPVELADVAPSGSCAGTCPGSRRPSP